MNPHDHTQATVSESAHTRRHFLHRALATTVAASVLSRLPGNAAEAPATPAAPAEFKRKIKLGVVGNGGRGAWIANLFKRHGGCEMWAVADYFQSVADACGDTLGVDKSRRFSGLNGYRRVIESGIEAIALETPPYFFPAHARAAVEAGLHVYMAKPVAVDVWGCLEVEAAAKKAGANQRVFLVDYQVPTDPANVEVVRRISSGEIGPVLALNSHYFAGMFADPPKTATLESRFRSLVWCNDVAVGGGYHVNACIHAVDAALWIAGQRPVSAMGYSRVGRPDPHGDSHDVFQLTFEYANGILHSHRGKHLNNLTGFDVVCQAQGQKGFGQIGYGGKVSVKGSEDGYNGEVKDLYEAGAVRNIAKFCECVVEGRTQNDTVRRAIDGALATILGREAGLRRRKVTMEELLTEKKRLDVDLTGLKA
jgi:predicted dehydrogenase